MELEVNKNDYEEPESNESLEDKTFKPEVRGSDLLENMPIYEGSALTLLVSMMVIMMFIMCHSMTGTVVLDLLAPLEAHMIAPNLCRAFMKLIRQFF